MIIKIRPFFVFILICFIFGWGLLKQETSAHSPGKDNQADNENTDNRHLKKNHGDTLKLVEKSVVTSADFPFGRADIRNALADMLDDWGESAFEMDEELVRHVSYFYKYYLIVDYARSNAIIKRSEKYLPFIIEVFNEYNLPEELAFAIPFVESSFMTGARSNRNAVGMFQFIKETAIIYGLKVNKKTDERKDYKKSVVACAKYLRSNKNLFASLVFSIGSYHHGTGKVSQVLLTASYTDRRTFSSIFKNKKLGKYSREYIPQCLSLALIYKFIKKRKQVFIPDMTFETRTIRQPVHVKKLEHEMPDLFALNPDLEGADKTYKYANGGYVLLTKIQSGKMKKIILAELSVPEKTTEIPAYRVPVFKWPDNPAVRPSGSSVATGQPKYIRYVFQEGNRIDVLASIFGTTEADIRKSSENRYLKKRHPIQGDIIRIDSLSPTTRKIGGWGYLCGRQIVFKTKKGENLMQVCKRSIKIIRYLCNTSKWQMGTDVTPALIYYWNQGILGNIGPGDSLKGGLSLTVYSDYLWRKTYNNNGKQDAAQSLQSHSQNKNFP
ncbi:MAG: transglycosylase SLT domain-containing protein [Desulfobacterales bacterium]|nr:transglycosylase SLT domain-containing protein [Desulfobacterales bacterium]